MLLLSIIVAVMSSCGTEEPTPNEENKNWEPLNVKMAELPKLCQSLLYHDTAEVFWQMSNAGFTMEYKQHGEIMLSRGVLKMFFYSEGGKMASCGFTLHTLGEDSIYNYWRDWEEQAYTYSTWLEWEALGHYMDPDKGMQEINTPYRDEWLEFLENARSDESELMFETLGQNKTEYYGFAMDINETTNEKVIAYQVGEDR